MSDFPTFAEFYRELHSFDPFPWQDRLAARVLGDGAWPANIGVPTGLGKTSTIDIAVWSLAADLSRLGTARRMPIRIWYVVNRRLLVDAAHERAIALQDRLAAKARKPDDSAVSAVASALADAQAVPWDFGPLHVTRLRGGAERGHRAPDPSCPTIALATVPMFGSRLLFRGYGSSAGLRPVDAALAGTDSLVLLDEAHLALPLQKVLGQLQDFPPPAVPVVPDGRGRPAIVNLSATGSERPEFDLDDDDRRHPIVAERLTASKPTSLSTAKDRAMATTLAKTALQEAVAVADSGHIPATVIFVNTARRAPEVRAELEKQLTKSPFADCYLRTLTGRIRPHDSTRLREELLGGDLDVSSTPRPDARERALFVVATQTLEVGADLDFDCLVTESAGSRSMVQRLGRLNRLGVRPWARAHIVHADDLKEWPVYGAEPSAVWERLTDHLGIGGSDTVDLGPGSVSSILGAAADTPKDSPELLPNHLRDWAKTSAPPAPWLPPVDPFILGEEEALRRATVLWRTALPRGDSKTNLQLRPLVHADEAVEVPVHELREFIAERTAWRLSDDGDLEPVTAGQVGVGDTIILPAHWGGHRPDGGWSIATTSQVADISAGLVREFVLTGSRIRELVADGELALAMDEETLAEVAALADARQSAWSGATWVEPPSEQAVDDSWTDRLLGPGVSTRRVRGGPVVALLHVSDSRTPPPRVDSSDELSTVSTIDESRSMLDAHLRLVGETAGAIGRAIGLDDQLIRTIELAGRVHDAGKADPRFQLLLGGMPGRTLAKSVPDQRADGPRLWPKGGRHEAVSVALFERWLESGAAPADIDLELAWHLIASHHGHGRPLVPATEGSSIITAAWTIENLPVRADIDLDRFDWSQPTRFERLNRRYGYWGLALLEAVLRQADHAESSRANDELVMLGEVQ